MDKNSNKKSSTVVGDLLEATIQYQKRAITFEQYKYICTITHLSVSGLPPVPKTLENLKTTSAL